MCGFINVMRHPVTELHRILAQLATLDLTVCVTVPFESLAINSFKV